MKERKQGRCRVRNLQDGSDGGRLCLTEKRESHQYPKGPLVMNCTFLQSSMRPRGGFFVTLMERGVSELIKRKTQTA